MRSTSSSSYLVLALSFFMSTSSSTVVAASADATTTRFEVDASRVSSAAATAEEPKNQQQQQQLDPQTIEAYERLDKWSGCLLSTDAKAPAPVRLVYEHNRSRAAATGFPTRLQVGTNLGLSHHETSAVFGWTTGDYRLLNPIARGGDVAVFDEYPFLPNDMAKVRCRLSRKDVAPYVSVLRSALSKLPALDCRQRLWRGHRRRLDNANKEVGSIITMRGFTSVTRDRENALEFAAKANEGRSDRRTLIGILDHSGGRCVSKLSARPDEMEVLFPPDAAFEVVDPPGDTGRDDMAAVQKAAERLREGMPGAEIDLVYVREVVRKEPKQPIQVMGSESRIKPGAQPIGEWD